MGPILGTVIKLAIISVLVGLAMNLFGVQPDNVFDFLAGALQNSFRFAVDSLHWAFQYLLIGAAVVIPIWLIIFLIRLAGKKG
ncbi:MAG: DUF6460 domain-containing protein [Rhodospirillales bacterium]